MASFIHITDRNDQASITKNGIKLGKSSGVVCATPVVPNFSISHQWARELKNGGARSMIYVQFKIPDHEKVWIGKYKEKHLEMTAAEATGVFLAHSGPVGFEVVIERKITPKEITRIYAAPRITGWRYSPEAKGKKPFCHCKYCHRGEVRAQRVIRDDP